MPLTSSLQIGRSALTASSLGIQVTGNNMANAATVGYSRQNVTLAPSQGSPFGGSFIGRGVEVQSVRRQVDDALQARLWSGTSNEAAANSDLNLLSQVEATMNELTDQDLSTQLSRFFNSWSELANSPNLGGNRSLVVQQGRQMASFVRDLRANLTDQRVAVDRDLAANTDRANELLTRIAGLNTAVVTAEQGSGNDGGLRDQRDQLLTELAQYMDITTVQQSTGGVDVLVGSTPVLLAGQSRGVYLKQTTVGGQTHVSVATRDNNEALSIRSGQIGSMLGQRETLVNDTIARLDTMTTNLIDQVNRLHSTGLAGTPLTSLTGATTVRTSDQTLSFNDPTNLTFQALPIRPTSGSFTVTVRNTVTGASQSVQVPVDLDGRTNTLAPGYADDTSLSTLRAALGSISNLSASITGSGALKIDAASGYEVSFSDDTSGVLSVLGVNTFFAGTDASNISVRDDLAAQPNLLAAARVVARTGAQSPTDPMQIEGDRVDNGTALLIAQLRDRSIDGLGGVSISQHWDQSVQAVAVKTAAAKTSADATKVVRESLDAQRSAISGVSVDEEAINLLNYQRQYQAGARFISVVDELTKTMLQLV